MQLRSFLPALGFALAALAAAPQAGARGAQPREASGFTLALESAERALEEGQLELARAQLLRALERDGRSLRAWALRARLAERAEDRDEQIYALHRELELAVAQGLEPSELEARRARLRELDPVASEFFGLRGAFVTALEPLAQEYEEEGRPHSAIRVHREILALAPEHAPSSEAIARISALPDPSLAEHAEPADLLADVSREWIREFDAEHASWDERARHESENYNVHTDAGYEVLVRCAEAMDQMNAFYRQFFDYAADGGKVPKIDLLIFKDHAEYLEKGSGPPQKWSGGQFTGGSVETHAEGGLASLTNVLFHEAAHQFVSLATNSAGWLNEGLASFFEGCRLQANGTVLMNMPATHRLFPLVERMERGWMSDHAEGLDAADPNVTPQRAPTFRMVLENKYQWGPAWYEPTWGVVYFLYNFQDPVDGRFVYRAAFREFVDKSGGRVGASAVSNFEQLVLGHPQKPLAGVERAGDPLANLPRTVEALDPLWKSWLIELRERQIGRLSGARPYLQWARYAVAAGDRAAAVDHFEKGLIEAPDDVDLLREFADLLVAEGNADRATKLLLSAARALEASEPVDAQALAALEARLAKADSKRKTVAQVQAKLWSQARAVVDRYAETGVPMMVMHVGQRLSAELGVPGLMSAFEAALRSSGKNLDLWQLAYDEESLEGWDATDDSFRASGAVIDSSFGSYSADAYDFRVLALDKITSGDFSLQADVRADKGQVGFAGLAFGRKSAQNFHALVVFPPKPDSAARKELSNSGWVDLASFYGNNSSKTWRHGPLPASAVEAGEAETSGGTWHTLRIDVVGNLVDAWVDGELIATQSFDARDVLAGGFGLITGPGQAQFKEVRFLSRPAGDPTAAAQRESRLAQLSGGQTPIADSYVGVVPPWPPVARWVQAERESWQQAGPVPQLLVIWSIQQNDLIPVHGWLGDLASKYEGVGLEIVSVASPNDDQAVQAYLAQHPFPGAVAVDRREGEGFGDTNEAYSTPRFGLPRLILLDVDQTVVWEGDPGFTAAQPYSRGMESFLQAPLEDLVARRKLHALGPWLERWKGIAAPALHAGELETALPVLRESLGFDAALIEPAYDAQRAVAAVESALVSLPATAERLAAEGREPACEILLEWGRQLELELPKSAAASVRSINASQSLKDWDRAQSQVKSWKKKIEKDLAEAEVLAARLDQLAGGFPAEIAAELRAAAAAGDVAAALTLLESAPDRPRLWLARQFFGW